MSLILEVIALKLLMIYADRLGLSQQFGITSGKKSGASEASKYVNFMVFECDILLI